MGIVLFTKSRNASLNGLQLISGGLSLSVAGNPIISSPFGIEGQLLISGTILSIWGDMWSNQALGIDNHSLINHPLMDAQSRFIKFNYGTCLEDSHAVLNTVKGQMENVTSANIVAFRQSLARNDELQAVQMLLQSIPNSISGSQFLLQLLSDGLSGNVVSFRNTLVQGEGIYKTHFLLQKFPDDVVGFHNVMQSIAGGIGSNLSLLNSLSQNVGSEHGHIQALLNCIDEANYIEGLFQVKQSFDDSVVYISSASVQVFLDNILLDRWIGNSTIDISFSQNSIHNEVTISSISQDLFEWGDPAISSGTPRIEIHIGERVLYFLVEKRTGSGSNFTLWGRDSTARDSSPWGISESLHLEKPTMASDVAESITKYSAVDWDADLYDWMLPETFEAEGTPTEVLAAIAQEIGAIVRSQEDGSFLIRKKYPVRPINLSTALTDTVYGANLVVDFSHNKQTGDHYNKVSVTSNSPDNSLPMIEIETLEEGQDRTIGTTSFVKVYWTDTSPEVQNTYVTDGNIRKVEGSGINGGFQKEITEIVEFKNGVGETTYPVLLFGDVKWIGRSRGSVDWSVYSKSLVLTGLDFFGLAKITYTTEYCRYELSDHSVEQLMAVFFYDESESLMLTVITDPIAFDENGELIDKVGPTITTDNLRLDSRAAVERGQAWLDSNKYDTYAHSFNSPYSALAIDGKAAWIDCARIGSTGNYYITEVGITIAGPKITNNLKVIQWQI